MSDDGPSSPAGRAAGATESRRERLLAFLATAAFVLLPVALVRHPPLADLPQQFHQVVLADRALRGLEPELVVQPLMPNRLGYVPLAVGWYCAGASEGPRVAMALLALAWTSAIHLYAWRSGVGVAQAVLASIFLFSRLLYCGFFNFLCGIFGLLLWLRELEGDGSRRPWPRLAAGALAASALLFCAHILWFVGGTAFALSVLLLRRFELRQLAARALGVLPFALLTLAWARGFGGAGWQGALRWAIEPLDRVSSLGALAELVLGGLRDPVEPLTTMVALVILGLGAAGSLRSRSFTGWRPVSLAAGASCLLAAILLPTEVDLTVFFNARWAPFAMVTLLLAAPTPRVRRGFVLALALATVAAVSATTTAVWLRFERDELAGFSAAIGAIPEDAKVIGLDLGDPNEQLRWDPFEHLAAYAGVERNARPSLSFTQLQSSLVVLRDPVHPPAWLPVRDAAMVRPADLANYDFALVRGAAERVVRLRSIAPPTAVVRAGPAWTVLAIGRTATAPPGP